MLSGELLFRFLNVMLLTALVAPLVLWRYRRAVLAGMQTRVGAAMPLAPPLGPRPRPAAAAAPGVDAKLAWEARMRRRIFVAVVAALLPPALLLAGHYVVAQRPADHAGAPVALRRHRGADGGADGRRARGDSVQANGRARRRDAVRLRRRLGRVVDAAAPRSRQGADARPAAQLRQSSSASPRSRSRCRSSSPRRSARAACAASRRSSSPACSCSRSRRCSAFTSRRLLGAMRWSAGWVLAGGHPRRRDRPLAAGRPARVVAAEGARARLRGEALLRCAAARPQLVAGVRRRLRGRAGGRAIPAPRRCCRSSRVAASPTCSFRSCSSHALAWSQRGLPAPPRRMLLVLRVFGDSARTGALFERIASRWQRFGPVTMIAAPDAAAGTVDPGDLLRFATGRIAAGFVTSQDDLMRRLATMDVEPDRDGRYRITEFCCRDDTWQATVVALIERADAIVMDLRGFTRRAARRRVRAAAARRAREPGARRPRRRREHRPRADRARPAGRARHRCRRSKCGAAARPGRRRVRRAARRRRVSALGIARCGLARRGCAVGIRR